MTKKPAKKPVRASHTILSDLTYPPNANIHGTVFGGHILQLVDKAAAVCGFRHAGEGCVTVALEKVEFLVPIRVGDFVSVEAQVNHCGRTSMEIGVEVFAENPIKGTRVHANTCLVTMVAVDKKGRPVPVPGLILETPEEKTRYAAAEARRQARRS
jgi:acyl-CoA hydrolase